MARKQITPLAKLVLILGVLAGLYFGYQWVTNNTDWIPQGSSSAKSVEKVVNPSGEKNLPEPINIGVVTWPGNAGGQFMNDGFAPNTESRMYREYGQLVRFKVLDDFEASRKAWMNGEVDLLWVTADAYPTEVDGLKVYNPEFLFQVDWSFGGDVIVAIRGINSMRDLRGRTIAVALGTPSHSFILWALKSSNMTVNDVRIIVVANATDAASAFKAGQVDAAVVWSPDDRDCLAAIPGSHKLTSTKEAPFIIADGFYAKREFVEQRFDDLVKLAEAWMVGAAEINTNPTAKERACQIMHEGFGFNMEYWRDVINNVRLCTIEDNKNFFGMNSAYTGVTGEDLYLKTGELYRQVGMVKGSLPAWRLVSTTRIISQVKLFGPEHKAWDRGFAMSKQDLAQAKEFSSKPISVVFAIGSADLDFNAKSIIDREVEEMRLFANLGISIEGNTDNTGSQEVNERLSRLRAQAVADYLVSQHGIDRNRIRVLGNGWNNPIATNETAEGRAQNRRTDFKLLK